jgi:hypothetical protein
VLKTVNLEIPLKFYHMLPTLKERNKVINWLLNKRPAINIAGHLYFDNMLADKNRV